MTLRLQRLILMSAALCFTNSGFSAAAGKSLLHPLFGDHGVLQRGRAVPVWGWADPGAEVTVRFAGQTKHARAAADGRWVCSLDPLEASFEGRTLEVEAGKAGVKAAAHDLLVGDLWLCSGQSNMEMGMTLCHEDGEIARADHPQLRLLALPHRIEYTPQATFEGNWQRCTPDALRGGGWGGFSATAYFFGKNLQEQLGVPIGLIHSSWGGTVAEAWTSADGLAQIEAFREPLDEVRAIANSKAGNPLTEALDAWFLKHDPGTAGHWQQEDTDISAWRTVTMPGTWSDCGAPGFEGVVWVQRRIDLPADWSGKPLVIQLGVISDADTTWINGREIGRTHYFDQTRIYQMPAGAVRPGANVITLRISNDGGGGIQGETAPMIIHPAGDPGAAIALSGSWRFKETATKAEAGRPLAGNPNVPGVLCNGMIAPLVPCAMTGVIWYQGESNVARAQQYRTLLPALIRDWRRQFGRDDLAFHIVSLANYQDKSATEQPGDDAWAELREAQAMTAKTVPHCGLAVAIDIGDPHDIHPKNKREVGRRLALSVLANTYGKSVVASGPWYRSADVEGGRIRIHFDHVEGGLTLRRKDSSAFSIAGRDRKFVRANAVIDGASVIVSSPDVPEPVAVRYAWDANPDAVLYNGAGLPAVPFRSDDWPGIALPH